jgi:4'-phosphopantetheinyl transferase
VIAARQFDHATTEISAPADSISLWKADLDWSYSDAVVASEILSADERERAAAFHQYLDQTRFVVARATLRLILGRYLEISPEKIRFAYNAFGKPTLDEAQADLDLRFNVAHSNGVALYAFALGRDIGVDLELIRPDFASMEIAQRTFARSETESLSVLQGDDFVDAFYRCWTRKEAYAKATGLGLSLPLDTFSVSVDPVPDQQVRLQSAHDVVDDRWRLMDVSVGDTFAAALCFETPTAGSQAAAIQKLSHSLSRPNKLP